MMGDCLGKRWCYWHSAFLSDRYCNLSMDRLSNMMGDLRLSNMMGDCLGKDAATGLASCLLAASKMYAQCQTISLLWD